jgi:RNA polymerase sigma-70 factor (ECF subfamily)
VPRRLGADRGELGRAPAALQPLVGARRASRFLLGLARLAARQGLRLRPVEVNGQPGAVSRDGEERIVGVLALDISGGRVQAVRSIVDPDKLGHLGPLALS